MKYFFIGALLILLNVPVITVLVYAKVSIIWVFIWSSLFIIPAIFLQMTCLQLHFKKIEKIEEFAIIMNEGFSKIDRRISSMESRMEKTMQDKEITKKIFKFAEKENKENKETKK